ncbi:hypothetical protein [Nocardioides coralli]|uniref:hypothetical protein n=1 Tax=Nocardioides coralli TaxID=2872154 RepID=UPI001CA3F12E|nr:hypothetical protein [Nocardioides coralli]QZY28777.1 hypothetical protein K6T13_15170 [Nocardioides coralli]
MSTTCTGQAINSPRVGAPAKVKLRVDPGEPQGWATFTYERARNGLIVAEHRRRYNGPGWNKYSFRKKLPRGNYIVRVWFNSTPRDSVYTNCRDTFEQRVRPRGRR